MQYIAFANGSVYTALLDDLPRPGTLLTRGGFIQGIYDSLEAARQAAAGDMEIVDIAGMTVMPGLIDCHVHLFLSGNANAASDRGFSFSKAVERAKTHLRAGVTTVRDVGAPTGDILRLRDCIAKGEESGPRVIASGSILTTPSGHGHFIGALARSGAELTQAIDRAASLGVDCIKIAVSGGVQTSTSDLHAVQYTQDDVRKAVEAAHERGLRVAAHASNSEAIRISSLAGVDSIEHAVMIDDVALQALVDGNSVVVPTLAATDLPHRFFEDERIPEYVKKKAKITVPAHRPSVRRAIAAGVRFAGGTDAGSTLTPHGGIAREVSQLLQCGMSQERAIAAVTRDAAALLGLGEELGTLEAGKIADLVVVAGDPYLNPTNLANVRLVVKDGQVVHRIP